MKKLLLSTLMASTMALSLTSETTLKEDTKSLVIEDFIVDNLDKENYDYFATYDKVIEFDNSVVKNDGTIYKGKYIEYVVNIEYSSDFECFTSIYVIDVVKDENGLETIVKIKEE